MAIWAWNSSANSRWRDDVALTHGVVNFAKEYMALIKCSECSHQVSTEAEACPNCGHPVNWNGDRSVGKELRSWMEARHLAGFLVSFIAVGTGLLIGSPVVVWVGGLGVLFHLIVAILRSWRRRYVA